MPLPATTQKIIGCGTHLEAAKGRSLSLVGSWLLYQTIKSWNSLQIYINYLDLDLDYEIGTKLRL